ncbi:heavy metal translocating P-type ATPase [Gracilimonas tropica]|uniref:heavy metal translocating P-type ATPase n=1 Tax=Gracilimonas tropica TaxID=454600 RepID=UPI000381CD28|nr:heavy metal translocating P-type ATPase [Gracilimonas tropica]
MLSFIKKYKEVALSSAFLIAALLFQHVFHFTGHQYFYLSLYGISYLFVGGPVWVKAIDSIKKGTVFSEFLLMGIATVGAFILGEYAEGVAVMLFYMIGEYAQGNAVQRARHSIQTLINQQPDTAVVEQGHEVKEVDAARVETGAIIQVKPGQKVPLDGILLSPNASLNTAALTGESKARSYKEGDEVWAGSINEVVPIRIKVTSTFKDTKLANILNMVQEATQRKAPVQRFMTRFAKVYTPIVVWLAIGVTFLPYFFTDPYVFHDWFYKALIFLVISCPCGLVISIPLGYFGGIGAASANGILLKGSDYLDQLRKMNVLYLDKTGTLTEGAFEVQSVTVYNGLSQEEVVSYAASLEQHSTHPIGKAILSFKNGQAFYEVKDQVEISGKGVKGSVQQKRVLVGNVQLLNDHGVSLSTGDFTKPNTYVHIAVEDQHAGTITISDSLKEDSEQTIRALKENGVKRIVMLSGDNQQVASYVADQLGIDEAYGNLLPEDKYRFVEQSLGNGNTVGFAGDGVNDAPVITLADVGIAMGGVGSDATIETADVVIQNDQPSKILTGIDISRYTQKIVWQNIGFALGIKILVMVLATAGLATMWEAIFADVGVALIAIANAIRIQYKFSEGLTFRSMFSGSQTDSQNNVPAACCDTCC